MDKQYEDDKFAHAFEHAQMMRDEFERKNFNKKPNQENRYWHLDKYMENLEMERQAKINDRSADLKKQIKEEISDSNKALLNILMRSLGLIAVATFFYMVFISFAGI